MTIQTQISDGTQIRTRTYRNVIKGVNLAQYREGFFAQESSNQWGKMIQLKGKERIVIARFGVEQEEHDCADGSCTHWE